MAIDMPVTPAFTDCQFRLVHHSQSFTSPLSRAIKRQELDGARWEADFTLPAMNKYQGQVWEAWFAKLKGMVNTFNGYNPDKPIPIGPAGGTPLVKLGSQTGTSLNIDGCTASAVFLKAGDMFSVNGELKMMTADATANGSGEVTLSFEPALRASPSDNAPITTLKPTCTMILVDDMQAAFTRNPNGIYQPKTFSAYEVFS